jgi:signal peptidase II
MPERTYRWLFALLAVVGLTADLASKYGVFRWLHRDGTFADTSGTGNEVDVVPGWFKLIAQFDKSVQPNAGTLGALQTWSAPDMPRVNHGALFGIGGSKKGTANGGFAVISVLAAVAIVVWGTRAHTARERGLMVALGLILGGTVGNLFDRLVFGGVRDFLYFYKIDWPVFNVADCCLVVGAGILLVQAILFAPAEEPKPSAAPAATDAPTVTEAPKA